MKPIKKPAAQCHQELAGHPENRSDSGRIRLTLVSEKERDIYRVPSYGYLLP